MNQMPKYTYEQYDAATSTTSVSPELNEILEYFRTNPDMLSKARDILEEKRIAEDDAE